MFLERVCNCLLVLLVVGSERLSSGFYREKERVSFILAVPIGYFLF
jgi:hypothetical protein